MNDTINQVGAGAPADRLREALAGLLAIVDESRGVAGYHLNGAIAEWDEFPEVAESRNALAAIATAPTVKESLSVAPSLPAAGSAREEVEVVGYAWINRYNQAVHHVAPFPPTEGGVSYGERLMTVAQHERIVAALAQTEQQPFAYADPSALNRMEKHGQACMTVWRDKQDCVSEPLFLLAAPIAQAAHPDAALREQIRSMTAMLENREWANLLSTDEDIARLDSAITALVGERSGASQPEQSGLVEALESAKNLIANHSGEVLPDKYAGDQIEQIDAAHRKQGGEV